MAIYHYHVSPVSRGGAKGGRSSVAAAAYISREKLKDEREGNTYHYNRRGGVVYERIRLPDGAPEEWNDRATLWNAVEAKETRSNSRTARMIDIALPAELTREQQIILVEKHVVETYVAAGMCADIAIHDKGDDNPHAHVLLCTRNIKDGAFDEKVRLWDKAETLEEWREAWARHCNEALALNGHDVRIDHRSYDRQGIDKIPSIHLGVAVHAMEKKGIETERGDRNREIAAKNLEIEKLKKQEAELIAAREQLLKEETEAKEARSEAARRGWETRREKREEAEGSFTPKTDSKAAQSVFDSLETMMKLEEEALEEYRRATEDFRAAQQALPRPRIRPIAASEVPAMEQTLEDIKTLHAMNHTYDAKEARLAALERYDTLTQERATHSSFRSLVRLGFSERERKVKSIDTELEAISNTWGIEDRDRSRLGEVISQLKQELERIWAEMLRLSKKLLGTEAEEDVMEFTDDGYSATVNDIENLIKDQKAIEQAEQQAYEREYKQQEQRIWINNGMPERGARITAAGVKLTEIRERAIAATPVEEQRKLREYFSLPPNSRKRLMAADRQPEQARNHRERIL
jgi:hypothetical protein